MKHIYISIIAILFSSSAISQTYLERRAAIVNESQIMSIIRKNILGKDYRYIIYQKIDSDIDIDETTTTLIAKQYNQIMYWIIKKDSILSKGKILSDSIFKYKNYLFTGVRKSEDFKGFIPPILCGVNTENIIYKDTKVLFYFEYGKNVCSFNPNLKYDSLRFEWLRIIRSEINRIRN